MTTVTVTGANGTTVVVNFEYPEYAALANSILPGAANNADFSYSMAGSYTLTSTMGDTYGFGMTEASAASTTGAAGVGGLVTVTDANNDSGQVILTGTGTTLDFINTGSGSGIILAGGGNDTFSLGAGNFDLQTGSISGGNTIDAGTGYDTLTLGGGDVLTLGAGYDTVFGVATDTTITGGSGTLEYVAGPGSTTTINGGTGFTLGFANDGASITYTGTSNNNEFVAGAGSATLDGSGASGGNTFFSIGGDNSVSGGAGNDFLGSQGGDSTLTGGGGTDIFDFFSGGSVGNDVVTDFTSDDYLYLNGLTDTGTASDGAGGTTMTLSDGTTIDFQNASSIDSSHIITGPGPG